MYSLGYVIGISVGYCYSLEDKYVFWFFAKNRSLVYGYNTWTDKYQQNVAWVVWNNWFGSFDNLYKTSVLW